MLVAIRVVEYVREDGSIPFKEWFDLLDPAAAAKVAAAQVRLSQGNTSSVKWFSGLGEYMIDWGPGYRIYLARDGEELIVLFGGGTKRRQQRDIEKAGVARRVQGAEGEAEEEGRATPQKEGVTHGTDPGFQADGSRAGSARSCVRSRYAR